MNNDDKKGSIKDNNSSKKNVEKKSQKVNERKKINWEEKKNVLQALFYKTYPLTQQNGDRILKKNLKSLWALISINPCVMDIYKNISLKNFKKLTNASDDVKSYFDS